MAERLTRPFSLYLLLELLAEESWRTVYAGELNVRPPGAPTTEGGFRGGQAWYSAVGMGLIRFSGQVNYVGSASLSLSSDEDQEVLGGVGISIRPARVAGAERPTVI
jgi:hypothetical protein